MRQEQVAAAIEVLGRYGIEVTAPWDGDQDDREAEVFRALCEALQAADDKGDDEATTLYGRLIHRHFEEARVVPPPYPYWRPLMSEDMVERVARAIVERACGKGAPIDAEDLAIARAAIEAMREPSDAFLALVAERMHDARFSRSGETYPVPRNFLRAVVDAALSEAAREELAKQAQELDMGYGAPSG